MSPLRIFYYQQRIDCQCCFEAVSGTLVDAGVKEYMSQTNHTKEYMSLTDMEKKECYTEGRERMLIVLFLLNSDPKILKQMTTDIHTEHLKNLNTNPKTVATAQQLMMIEPATIGVQTK